MPQLVEIVFRNGGKVYSFDPAGLELGVGDQVIVRTSKGIELGKVVVATHEVPDTEVVTPLEKVVRVASDSDLSTMERNEKLAGRAAQVCEEKIREYGLEMRLINTEVVFDGSKIILSFFSEDRVDFRKLVEDLAKKFRTRIEFRQVGVRDEARMIGGYGPCGRKMCCTMYAGDQQPVSIKMAKEQNLPLNPMKISGICGRLMCCLKYEHESYKEFKQKAPRKGTLVSTGQGEGTVVDFCIPRERVRVDMGEGRQLEVPLDEIGPPGRGEAPKEQPRPEQPRREQPRRESRGRGGRGRAEKRPDKNAEKSAETSSEKKEQGGEEKPAEQPRGRGRRRRR